MEPPKKLDVELPLERPGPLISHLTLDNFESMTGFHSQLIATAES